MSAPAETKDRSSLIVIGVVSLVLIAIVTGMATLFPGAGKGPVATPAPTVDDLDGMSREGRILKFDGKDTAVTVIKDGTVPGDTSTLTLSKTKLVFTNAVVFTREGDTVKFPGRRVSLVRPDSGATVSVTANGMSEVIVRVPKGIPVEIK